MRRPGMFPKGPNVPDLQGTLSGLLGDQQKIDELMKKVFFICSSVCFTRYYFFLLQKTNIQKFCMGKSTGRLRDQVTGRPRDRIMGRFGEVRGTSVIYVF